MYTAFVLVLSEVSDFGFRFARDTADYEMAGWVYEGCSTRFALDFPISCWWYGVGIS